MTKMAKKSVVAVIASVFMAMSVMPAQANPGFAQGPSFNRNVETVEYRGNGRHYRGPGPARHGYDRGYRRGYERGYDRGYGRHAYNGRGWGHRPPPRRYYRENNNDAWVPLAILGAGALIIGGAVAANQNQQRTQRTSGLNPKHMNWCESRYRSYRAYDNSFQPYNGPRKQCLSPYY